MKKILASVGLMSLGLFAIFAITVVGMFLTHGWAEASGNNQVPNKDRRGNGPRPEPIPDDESVWEDIDSKKLKNKARLKNRPGNYEVLKLSYDFLNGAHQIEPTLDLELAFPFQKDSKTFEDEETYNAYYLERENNVREGGNKRDNDYRAVNFVVNNLDIQSFEGTESTIEDPASHLLSDRDAERFKQVRKAHPGYCALVHIIYTMKSLTDDTVAKGPNSRGFVLCWVKKDDGWKLVWFDK